MSATPLHRVTPVELEREAPPWQEPSAELVQVAVDLGRELTTARRELSAAAAENADLRRKLRELQTWVDASARFESVEQLQLGRLLALRAAVREERRVPFVNSLPTILLLLYAVAALLVAWLLISRAV